MKTSLILLVAAIVLVTPAFAVEKERSHMDTATVVKNLINNLKSENKGVIESSAYMLGEFKSKDALIPLLAILHTSPDESTRIIAALSLSKIGTDRGIFAVKQAVEFDDSPRVRVLCAWFVNQYSKPEPFQFIQIDDAKNMSISQREQFQR
jgi:HEAT repeat protein